MSISPYTMDVLYKNGSIDYMPYDLMMPIPYAQPQNQTKKYNTYNQYSKNQVQSPSVALNSLGMGQDYYNVNNLDSVNQYANLTEKEIEIKKNPVSKKDIFKGLLATAIIVGTVFWVVKGVKLPEINIDWSKLNPKNWFKK